MSTSEALLPVQPLVINKTSAINKPRPRTQTFFLRMPFYYLQVTEPEELNRFIAQYAKVSGNDLPEEYLRRALVYQFYKGYRPVAGFILNTIERNSLRYFSYLNETVRNSLLSEEDLAETDFLEITSNWKSGELSASESRTYYSVMLKQACQQARLSGKKLLLGGSVVKPIKKIQQRLMNRVIYHGPIAPYRQRTVKEQQPLLKLYVIPVSQVRWRATIIVWQRYLGQMLRTIFPKKATQAAQTS